MGHSFYSSSPLPYLNIFISTFRGYLKKRETKKVVFDCLLIFPGTSINNYGIDPRAVTLGLFRFWLLDMAPEPCLASLMLKRGITILLFILMTIFC